MLTFLRKIRKTLISNGSSKRYLLYAIGEIALVVIGILIALQINNWNDLKKMEKERYSIIQDMQNDWKDTSERLDLVENQYDSLTANMERFLIIAFMEDEEPNLDTLSYLAGSFFRYFNFNPNLTTYNEAQSSGKFSLVGDDELPYLFTEFFQHLEDYNNHIRLCSEIYYHGSTLELRKRTGFISFYDEPDFYKMITGKEVTLDLYLNSIRIPEVSAAFENQWNVMSNLDKILGKIRTSTNLIMEKLAEIAKN